LAVSDVIRNFDILTVGNSEAEKMASFDEAFSNPKSKNGYILEGLGI
jgi:hypothetical protein